MSERENKFTAKEIGYILNHVDELAALNDEDFEELINRTTAFDWSAKQLSQFLHPDFPGNLDLGRKISRDVDLVIELVRQAKEKRGDK